MPIAADAVSIEETLVVLLLIAAAVAVAVRRVGVPYTVGLVVVGLIVGLVTHPSAVSLSSDLVFYVFLPILLFEAAFNLEARHLLADWRRVLALAVPGVLVAFALTAAGVHLLGGTTWVVALLFGALIAATDPVSVVALFRRLGVPERLTTMVEAESLFNDGTAAVVFAIVLAAVVDGGSVGVAPAVGRFVWMAVGGMAVGLAVGYVASALHRRIDDHLIEVTLSTIVAFGAFLLGQLLGMSGVVACVTAGIVVGNYGRHRGMGPVTRVTMGTVWEYAAFVANSLIFLLIGLRLDLSLIVDHVGLVLIAFAVVVAARAVTVYGLGAVFRVAGSRVPFAWQHVLVWGGLRGTIALALVLSVPADVPGRETLQVVTFGVVLLSLVGQGLTMPVARAAAPPRRRRRGAGGRDAATGAGRRLRACPRRARPAPGDRPDDARGTRAPGRDHRGAGASAARGPRRRWTTSRSPARTSGWRSASSSSSCSARGSRRCARRAPSTQ